MSLCSQAVLQSSPSEPLFQPHLFPTPLLSVVGKGKGGSSPPPSHSSTGHPSALPAKPGPQRECAGGLPGPVREGVTSGLRSLA